MRLLLEKSTSCGVLVLDLLGLQFVDLQINPGAFLFYGRGSLCLLPP